jgi:hypothetical protein
VIKLRIGTTERVEDSPSSFDDGWIQQEFHNAERPQGICVRVTVEETPIDMELTTPGCPRTSGAVRKARDDEQRIFDLWDRCGLYEHNPTPNGVVGFLQQLRNFL